MSPTIVILLVTAVLTVAAIITLLWTVVRRTTSVVQDLADLQERIGPDLDQLRQDAAVASRELEQLSASLERLQDGEGQVGPTRTAGPWGDDR